MKIVAAISAMLPVVIVQEKQAARTIPEIKPSHIYELLRPIRVEKRETANRVRGRIENDHREKRRR